MVKRRVILFVHQPGNIVSQISGIVLRNALGIGLFALAVSGCDLIQQQMGIEDPEAKATRLEAEGRAVGGGCRQSGRAIEDCYAIYSWLPKAPIYEGWRDMDAYMRENKLETISPQLPPVSAPGARRRAAATDSEGSSQK